MADRHDHTNSDHSNDRNSDSSRSSGSDREKMQRGDGMNDVSRHAGSREQGGGREAGSQSDRGIERRDLSE